MDKLNVLIAGSTGYIGTQLVKLLCKHKNIKIKYLCGNTSVGKNISYYDKDLKKYKLPKVIKINYKLFKDHENWYFVKNKFAEILLMNKDQLFLSFGSIIPCLIEKNKFITILPNNEKIEIDHILNHQKVSEQMLGEYYYLQQTDNLYLFPIHNMDLFYLFY